jgi:hypothetical protein
MKITERGNENDVDDPFMGLYIRLQNRFYDELESLVAALQGAEADGQDVRSITDMLGVRWNQATHALRNFQSFCIRHGDRVSCGVPQPYVEICLRCKATEARPGKDLCMDCAIVIIQIGGKEE